MALNVAVQMDPIERINIRGDSTFALLLEAQHRAHALSYYTPDRLALADGKVSAAVRPLAVRDALGDRPVNIEMMIKYGSYPRYRLLVTYFLETQHWSIDQLLQTKMTEDEATAIMRTDANR